MAVDRDGMKVVRVGSCDAIRIAGVLRECSKTDQAFLFEGENAEDVAVLISAKEWKDIWQRLVTAEEIHLRGVP